MNSAIDTHLPCIAIGLQLIRYPVSVASSLGDSTVTNCQKVVHLVSRYTCSQGCSDFADRLCERLVDVLVPGLVEPFRLHSLWTEALPSVS